MIGTEKKKKNCSVVASQVWTLGDSVSPWQNRISAPLIQICAFLHPHCCENTVSFRLSLDPNTHTRAHANQLAFAPPQPSPLVKRTGSSRPKSVSLRPVSRTLSKARWHVLGSFPRLCRLRVCTHRGRLPRAYELLCTRSSDSSAADRSEHSTLGNESDEPHEIQASITARRR